MAEAVVSILLDHLTSTILQEIEQEVKLVVGVDREVEELKSKLGAIQAVLLDAEQKQVKERAVRHWLQRLKDTSYDMEDVLEDWKNALLKFQTDGAHGIGNTVSKKKVRCFFPSSCFGINQVVLCHEIAHRMKDLNRRLDTIAREKDSFSLSVTRSIEKQERRETTSLDVDLSEICGRDIEKKKLLEKLLCESSSKEQQNLHVISIVGMGGIGKTTLAQFIYNNEDVISHFDEKIWVCVSDLFDQYKIAKAIIEALKVDSSELSTLQNLLERVKESISGKKLLLVLDDVWIEDDHIWEPFYHRLKNGLHGSKVLVTTRKRKVADTMKSNYILPINELSKIYCDSLFRQIAFYDWSSEECEKVGVIVEKIVDKCKGLPLAIKAIGSLLRFKKDMEDWKLILDSEMWELEEFEKGIFPPLLLSYYDLPPMIKPCFLYCSTFPKDWELDRNQLIYLWMAQGYLGSDENKMEKTGNNYFDMLIARSLIIKAEPFDDNIYKMHDIMHDVALFLSQKESFTIEDNDSDELSINEKTRHLMFISHVLERSPIPSKIANPKKLRSLLIIDVVKGLRSVLVDHPRLSMFPPMLFEQLTYLKALYLSLDIFEIPKEIKNLINLKFLDLSTCYSIRELPDAFWELYNLETLVMCPKIYRLPKGIGKLMNLRHLILKFEKLGPMPRQIERLTCLQTLTKFVIGDDNLECLKNLNKLRGHLIIRGLGNLTDSNVVKKAEFKKKKDLLKLDLLFDGGMVDHNMNHIEPAENCTKCEEDCKKRKEHHEKLLEAIEPPPNLESLYLFLYEGGSGLPNWMMSLRTLKNLEFCYCDNWKCLPPLGQWPHLESLHIYCMENIERVGKEFLGIESTRASSSSSEIIAFPKLKHLKFSNMFIWQAWDYRISEEDEEHITIMPHLRSLEFSDCKYLEILPKDLFQKTTLEILEVDDRSSPILKEQYEKWRKRKHAQDNLHHIK